MEAQSLDRVVCIALRLPVVSNPKWGASDPAAAVESAPVAAHVIILTQSAGDDQ